SGSVIHACSAAEGQPQARPPGCTGGGNLRAAIRRYNVGRLRAVIRRTSRIRKKAGAGETELIPAHSCEWNKQGAFSVPRPPALIWRGGKIGGALLRRKSSAGYLWPLAVSKSSPSQSNTSDRIH